MKHADERPYANPEAAARKPVELAANVEAVQDGRIYIERINAPFLFKLKGAATLLAEAGATAPENMIRAFLQLLRRDASQRDGCLLRCV
ncbi:hypothetical protein [Bradyrhizobium liaoningense]|uniref:hypothetical protein n=1 Tax=Bradyrhizobium liaoningense TaxID=43992 RepID=UPI001BA4ECC5|nr:hypothetical protein [Bradyrhizobium liaoningense]MBR0823004.1 hypothetical protein [Bradyrhizobium liaoningense]